MLAGKTSLPSLNLIPTKRAVISERIIFIS
jgi:hypothetical protein